MYIYIYKSIQYMDSLHLLCRSVGFFSNRGAFGGRFALSALFLCGLGWGKGTAV